MPSLRKVSRAKTVTQKTHERLSKAITSNSLLPGQVLVIESLARELGVSRTPVREALLLLENEGFVEAISGQGFFVAGLSSVDLHDLFELREALEVKAIEKVIAQGASGELSKMRPLLEEYCDREVIDSVDEVAEADLAFHRRLIYEADNRKIIEVWTSVASQLRRFWVEGRWDAARVRADIKDCLQILQAIEDSNWDSAVSILRRHLETARESFSGWDRLT